MIHRIRWVAVSVFFLTLLLTLPALAQYGASLEGTVSDKSGAVVQGATVTVTNQATGVSQSTVTSGSGFYRVGGLTPGAYQVTVDAASFKKSAISGVQVQAETQRGLNIVMDPGQAQQTVTVTEQSPGVETENANVSGTLSNQQVENLPAFGRDPYELLRLAPGVFGDGARGGGNGGGSATFLPNNVGTGGSINSIYQVENQPQISANGQRSGDNNFTIDGVDVNSLTNGGSAVVTPTEESVAEITVLSSTYAAEDGRNSGAQVKVISKTGTNSFHGSAFLKYGEPNLNAFNNFGGFQGNNFARAPNVRFDSKLRNFGGSIGGPIMKNKIFFFFAYEGEHRIDKNFANNYIETPQFIQAVTAANPNSIAAKILNSPGTTPLVNAFLTPSCADVNGPCQVVPGGLDLGSPFPAGSAPGNPYLPLNNNVGGAALGGGFDGVPDITLAQLIYTQPRTGNQYNARVDWNLNAHHTIAGSTYLTNSTSTNTPGTDQTSAPNRNVVNKPFSPAATILWNWVVSPTVLNEARLNFSRFAFNEVTSNSLSNWGIPDAEIQDILRTGRRIWFGLPQGSNTPGLINQNTYGIGDNLSKTLSKHGLKFGFQYRKEQNNNNEIGLARPLYTFSHLWNFANDAPIFEQNAADPRTGIPDPAQRHFRTSYYGGFAQDDWKMRPNFTLNLGLRYEYYTPFSEINGLLSNLALAGTGPTAIANGALVTGKTVYTTNKNAFAPRIGFAWSPRKFESKMVVRGGFGVYNNFIPAAAFDNGRENPPFHALFDSCCGTAGPPFDGFGTPYDGGLILYSLGSSNSPLSYPGNPKLGGGVGPNNFLLNGSAQVYFAPQHIKMPYVYGYSLETQMEFPGRLIATIGYQGSDSHNQLRIFNANQVFDANSPHVNPGYYIKPDANANYNSLNARLQRRFAHGFQIDSKYRWSKSMDHVSYGMPDSSANETFPRDLRTEYGPSDFDTTHFAVVSGIWELPIFRGQKDFIGKVLGGWQLTGIYTYHSGFPWTPIDNNCFQTPVTGICPIRPVAYFGGAGNGTSNDVFLTKGGDFPGGGANFFQLTPTGPPGVGRNSFRGPRYQAVDMTFGKNTRFPFIGEQGNLQLRLNAYNVFNHLNLSPFSFNSSSTQIGSSVTNQNQYFGTAGFTPALAGRVLEIQGRLEF